MLVVSCREHGHPFDFNFCCVVDEPCNLYQDHCRKMFPHVFSVTFANFSCSFEILDLVSYVDHEPRDIGRLASGGVQHCDYVCQCVIELLDKVVANDFLDFVPGDLPGDEEQLAACVCKHTI